MSTKTVRMTNQGIKTLPQDKPVLYKVLDSKGENIYTGIAKRGNVQERIKDHMAGQRDTVPGASKVQIQQLGSIGEAERKERNTISQSKPKYNQQGK